MDSKFMKQISIITYHACIMVIQKSWGYKNRNTFPAQKNPLSTLQQRCHKMENIFGDILRRVMQNIS